MARFVELSVDEAVADVDAAGTRLSVVRRARFTACLGRSAVPHLQRHRVIVRHRKSAAAATTTTTPAAAQLYGNTHAETELQQ